MNHLRRCCFCYFFIFKRFFRSKWEIFYSRVHCWCLAYSLLSVVRVNKTLDHAKAILISCWYVYLLVEREMNTDFPFMREQLEPILYSKEWDSRCLQIISKAERNWFFATAKILGVEVAPEIFVCLVANRTHVFLVGAWSERSRKKKEPRNFFQECILLKWQFKQQRQQWGRRRQERDEIWRTALAWFGPAAPRRKINKTLKYHYFFLKLETILLPKMLLFSDLGERQSVFMTWNSESKMRNKAYIK